MTNHLAARMRLSGLAGKTDGKTIGKALGGRPGDTRRLCSRLVPRHNLSNPTRRCEQMSHDEERARRTRLSGGSLITIALVFCFMSMVVVAILLGALTVTLGVVLLVVPVAAIARLAKTRRPPR
jgi:hypothetical protein